MPHKGKSSTYKSKPGHKRPANSSKKSGKKK